MFKVAFEISTFELIEFEIEADTRMEAVRIASARVKPYLYGCEKILEIFVKKC